MDEPTFGIQHMMSKALKFIASLFIFIVLLSLLGFFMAIRPMRITSTFSPANFGVKHDNVTLKTSDQIDIKGWFIPSKKPQAKTIILLHGYPADKGDILPSRLFLHDNYNLLFIDFRFLGESGGYYSTAGAKEVRDLKAAIEYLKKKNIHEVGVWGLSMGGAVAIMASKDTPEIKAIIAEAPYANLEILADNHYPIPGLDYIIGKLFRLWGIIFLGMDVKDVSPATIAKDSKIPMLIFYSERDRVIPVLHGHIMQKATADNTLVKVIIQKDKRHGEVVNNYQEIISNFFGKNL